MLTVDTFWEQFGTRLEASGWVLVSGSRYDPTHITGLTPSGRTFTLDIVFAGAGGVGDVATATLAIAGRTRTVTLTRSQMERGDQTVDSLVAARALFPANQQ